ncbi:hypothetical protein EVAR_77848_1 [Eumeta japonica]|uniref:Uncharacterized protein n=1 Tax=Eumeta variegata TaxID=151549 RepID=A0A4C1TEL8_EUMVA|nr:hypothetical protein EVAR_77848_1 [Eumeta japonica]
MPRVLSEDDIINILLEDRPFDGESVCSFESDDENNNARENDLMVFGDLSSQLQLQFDSDFDSDDDMSLSNCVLHLQFLYHYLFKLRWCNQSGENISKWKIRVNTWEVEVFQMTQ